MTEAEKLAKQHHIPITVFPADWDKFGKSAGYKRNVQMAEYAGSGAMLIAFWDGKSSGTKNMIENATKLGLKVHIINY